MNEKTKKILIRRRIREVITVKQKKRINFICENCGAEHIFNISESLPKKELGDGKDTIDISISKICSNEN